MTTAHTGHRPEGQYDVRSNRRNPRDPENVCQTPGCQRTFTEHQGATEQ